MDVFRAAELAQEGLDLWQACRLADAAERYKEALTHADPEHHATPGYHQQLAGVLASLGEDGSALDHLRQTLELEQGRGEYAAIAIAVARYFLAEHYAEMRQPSAALEVVGPSLAGSGSAEPLLRMVQAECLWQLGRIEEARDAAQRAVDGATSVDQRGRIERRLAMMLGKGGPNGPSDNGQVSRSREDAPERARDADIEADGMRGFRD
jgi:tetratricopeptide (TPR) repeat protein